jgi:cob(I)alamin adenosyltransferase
MNQSILSQTSLKFEKTQIIKDDQIFEVLEAIEELNCWLGLINAGEWF